MSSSPSPDAPPASRSTARAVAVIVVLGFSSLCAALMQSLVIPIQSELPELLGTTASNSSWIVTATLLGGGVAMPVTGRLADLYGKKPVLVVSADDHRAHGVGDGADHGADEEDRGRHDEDGLLAVQVGEPAGDRHLSLIHI